MSLEAPSDDGRGRPVGYVELVAHNADFRNLWFGEIVSLLGDWFNLIASATLIGSLTGSSTQAIGSLFVVRMLASFATGPFGGVLADRLNRRHLLIATDLVRAVVVLGFLFVDEPGDKWLLYVLTAAQLGLTGIFVPARNALLPEVVSRRELGTANALTSATWSVMLAVGAALGGLVSGAWGVSFAFAIDSATFLVSAWFLWRIAFRPERVEAVAAAGPMDAITDWLDGLRYLFHQPDMFAIALHKFAIALTVSGAFQVIQVPLALDVYGGTWGLDGSVILGIFYAIVGVGTGIGPIAGRVFTGDRHSALRRAITLSYVVSAAGLLLVSLLPSFPVTLLGIALRGIGGGLIWVFSTQLLLDLLPDRVRGRVFGTEFALFTLANAMGAGGTGWAIDAFGLGLGSVTALVGALTLVPGALWLLWEARRARGSRN